MMDIVERLRAPNYWLSGSSEGHEGENDAPFDAAEYIKEVREKHETMTELCEERDRYKALCVSQRLALEYAEKTWGTDEHILALPPVRQALALTPDDMAGMRLVKKEVATRWTVCGVDFSHLGWAIHIAEPNSLLSNLSIRISKKEADKTRAMIGEKP